MWLPARRKYGSIPYWGLFKADVVFYDPQLDIAVLRSEELTMAPLQWASATAVTGEDAIVMGFPN